MHPKMEKKKKTKTNAVESLFFDHSKDFALS